MPVTLAFLYPIPYEIWRRKGARNISVPALCAARLEPARNLRAAGTRSGAVTVSAAPPPGAAGLGVTAAVASVAASWAAYLPV
jgi:hypothetical protein